MALEDRSERIDHHAPRLLWQQVANDIAAEIQGGELEPGVKMPTEIELSYQYGVARVTIRRAIQDLTERNLVVRLHGRGTFVAER